LELGFLCVPARILVWETNSGPRAGDDDKTQVPLIGWALVNDRTGETVLVDAGGGDDAQYGSNHHNPLTVKPEHRLASALKNRDLELEAVRTVILTHLHWDHALGALQIPKAEIIVQKTELQYAVAPDDAFRKMYELDIPHQIPYFFKFFSQIRTVAGDAALAPGIRLLHLPGHSAGNQGVMVDTKSGVFIIPGDLINIRRNWSENLPPGIHCDLSACYASMEKLRKIASAGGATVLYSHDLASFALCAKQ
jgi:glyoxylase-like metal-dependent hydrolase (beta-lactamase superfamily II)